MATPVQTKAKEQILGGLAIIAEGVEKEFIKPERWFVLMERVAALAAAMALDAISDVPPDDRTAVMGELAGTIEQQLRRLEGC